MALENSNARGGGRIVRMNQFLELARDMIALEREVYQRVMDTAIGIG